MALRAITDDWMEIERLVDRLLTYRVPFDIIKLPRWLDPFAARHPECYVIEYDRSGIVIYK